MDFSLQNIGDTSMHYFESDTESGIQLVFLPGGLNPGLWKHQLKYFSRSFKTIAFQPTVSYRDFESEVAAAKKVIEQDSVENAVLVSNLLGNPVAQRLEPHEKVVAEVMTGCSGSIRLPPRTVYNMAWKLGSKKPKLVKKMFFSELTQYRIVQNFLDDLEKPGYMDLRSFIANSRIEPPVKNALVIHADSDPFSSKDDARKLRPNASVSVLQDAGTFSFYEKPQEYNKALHDFLDNLEGFVEKREVLKTKEKNRSLKEFESEKKAGLILNQ